jgi:hypothetical protein
MTGPLLSRAFGGWLIAALAGAGPALAGEVDYARDIRPLFKAKCWACHGALKQEAGLRLDNGSLARQGSENGPVIAPGDAAASLLIERVSAAVASDRMPPEGDPLTREQIARLTAWIAAGAASPVDESVPENPREHWAFQPLRNISPSGETSSVESAATAIDGFVHARLRAASLEPAPQADRVTLARRLYLDMHGLPPTPEQVDAFVADERPDAWARLVEQVLASPRYGERWAQHWLDVVRYGDTHGYEVNTPRDNAWPYRDYVIRAFNDDKPYDRFVFEQLAGDATGEHAATGFLVAAPALLPGQIGADDESKRQARQDALDEIIVGTGSTFLGLTIGCARCHDHKFDPITQQDYYGLQAYFAGVEYGDREIDDPARRERLAQAAALEPQIAQRRARLAALVPQVFAGRTLVIDDEDAPRVTMLAEKQGHGENPAGSERGYRDDRGTADRIANLSGGRYTWWANKPDTDVFAWNPGVAGRFRLWISWGTYGGGAHTRDARYLLDADGDLQTTADQREIAQADQSRFAGQTEGDADAQPLWSGLFDAGIHEWTPSTRLVLRGGDSGTAITADVVVLQEALPGTADVARPRWPQLRGPADPAQNVERIAPVTARFVRFTTLETLDDNLHEPCLDELEIFTVGGEPKNVALAALGTRATSSGNISETGIHQLKHVNDGLYGNSQSWISNEKGAGWVQLQLAEPATIERIVWGRDREGQFKDRLPVRYRIEVSMDAQAWTTVASSDDRLPAGTPHDEALSLARNSPGESAEPLRELVEQVAALEAQRTELQKPSYVYAGTFRAPDMTYVLNRGNPEQKEQQVGPRVPVTLGNLALPNDAPEQARRVALAQWITSPENPLTARVMVNRVWQSHFGRGLVETASDFGLGGARPSHPKLLDFLAAELVRGGWSIKRLQRMILLSETYRQSNRIDPRAAKADADCQLLWRFPARRLEAEAIRDSMLATSGRLNLQMGGPGFNFFTLRGGLTGFPPIEKFGPAELRRMIYAHKIRREPVPVFGAFDCPDAGQSAPKRSQSTTAIQALNLFNSPFVHEQSQALAQRAEREAADAGSDRVRVVYRLALAREPSETESAAASEVVHKHGLEVLCRVMFNCNEFLMLP